MTLQNLLESVHKTNSHSLRIKGFTNRNPRQDLNLGQSTRAKQQLWIYRRTSLRAFDNDGIDSMSYFVFINMFIFVSFQFIIYL